MPPISIVSTTAAQKLALSQLKPQTQLELLSGEVNLEAFNLQMRDKAGIHLIDAITKADVERTIDGASTLTVGVDDDLGRTIQTSGRLGKNVDVNLDGLWFTLVQVKKQQRGLDLIFEEREVNVLRHYRSFIKADRTEVTRAQFVLRMIKEVKEVPLKWYIPELNKKSEITDLQPGQILIDQFGNPLGDYTADPANIGKTGQHGIPTVIALTVKGESATPEQIKNANTVLRTGESLGARRKVLVCSIMTAIDESSIINLSGGDRDSVGVFQQRRSQGWPATRNVAVDAAEFFKRAMALDARNPNLTYNDLCQGVQHSGTPLAYGQYQSEADTFVNAYGTTGSDFSTAPYGGNNQADPSATTASGVYQYTRGTLNNDTQQRIILTPEDSWTCMQRLANEVAWRCFCVSGTIWFISDTTLLEAEPYMVISEDTDGVQWIDYDYDEGKRVATVTVQCHMARWSAPPGSTVQIHKMGIINGKWIVNSVTRSLYSTEGTITLKKARPVLPEATSNASSQALSLQEPPQPAGARNGGTESTSSIQDRIVGYANSQLNVPYQYGAEDPGVAFDCSGLTQATYDSVGISLPHNAQAQYDLGPQLSIVDILQPGDLVYFGGSTTSIEHVGIYIGGGSMIDAPHTGAVVRVDDNFRNWTNPKYVGASRPWM